MTKKNTFSTTFTAQNGHVSTSGKLMMYNGRKNGGADMYFSIPGLAETFNGLPEEVEITVTVTPVKGAGMVDDCLAVVPRTEQNRFAENKAQFSEIYGIDLDEHCYNLLNGIDTQEQTEARPKAAPKKKKAATKRTTKTKAATTTKRTTQTRKAAKDTAAPKAKPKTERGTAPGNEGSSLMDRMDRMERMVMLLVENSEK